jgi:hypothetical protein
MFEIFHARRNEDLIEGRGRMITVGYFSSKEDAEVAANEFTYMGNVPAGSVELVRVAESFGEFSEIKNLEVKERALSKLSSEERRVLGF